MQYPNRITLSILLGLVLFLPACFHKIQITTNTLANRSFIPQGFAKGASFFIKPLNTENKMLAQETSEKLEFVLKHKGYTITQDLETADYYLIFSLSMSNSKSTIHVPKYVPGTIITDLFRSSSKITSFDTYTYVPEEHTFYTKIMVIQVYDAKAYRETKKEEQVWEGTATTTSEVDDLRDATDYLLFTSFRYFGKNTQKQINTSIDYDAKEIKEFRKGIFPQPQVAQKSDNSRMKNHARRNR